jgi:aryl-alcohol dehydrogenase-like predicted oxidoreductase
MRSISIPHTDLAPSALCMGTADYGASIDRQTAFKLLDTFVDQGGNFLDTASVYSDWIPGERSRSEKLLGEWMKLRRNREDLIVATKGAHFHLDTPHISRVTPPDIIEDVEASLKNLQVDCIDIYYLHRDNPDWPVADIIETLAEQARAGKIRYYACSNWKVERLSAAQEYAREHGLAGFSAVQNLWNLANIQTEAIGDPTIVVMEGSLWEYHRQNNLAAIPFSGQANGLFQKLENGLADTLDGMHQRMYLNPVTEQRFQRVQTLRAQTGLTTTQIVLGYLLSQPFPTIPVFSSRSLEQLHDTLSAAEVQLTSEQLDFLN